MKLSSWIPNTDRWQGWSMGEDDIKPLGLADGQPGPWQTLQHPVHTSGRPEPQCAMHTTELCLPTLTHPFPSGPAKEPLHFSQRDQSQHTGWILPICLQQLHLANKNDAATDQILIKSGFSGHLEARRHLHTHTLLTWKWLWQNYLSFHTKIHTLVVLWCYASNGKHVITVIHLMKL